MKSSELPRAFDLSLSVEKVEEVPLKLIAAQFHGAPTTPFTDDACEEANGNFIWPIQKFARKLFRGNFVIRPITIKKAKSAESAMLMAKSCLITIF